jgi:hypothetical protein
VRKMARPNQNEAFFGKTDAILPLWQATFTRCRSLHRSPIRRDGSCRLDVATGVCQTIATSRRRRGSAILCTIAGTTGRRQLVTVSATALSERTRRLCRISGLRTGFGGQALYINGETVLAYKTQDAGKINTYYFTGPNCGGTGWIIFDINVPKTRWAETLAMVGKSDDWQRCGKNYPAWTRFRRGDIASPFLRTADRCS